MQDRERGTCYKAAKHRQRLGDEVCQSMMVSDQKMGLTEAVPACRGKGNRSEGDREPRYHEKACYRIWEEESDVCCTI